LTGRLTRDPEMRSLASGKAVTQFSVKVCRTFAHGVWRPSCRHVVRGSTHP
jgi:single-stranded DNA-binding protein